MVSVLPFLPAWPGTAGLRQRLVLGMPLREPCPAQARGEHAAPPGSPPASPLARGILWASAVAKTELLGVIVQDLHKEEMENHRSRETKPDFQIGRSCLDKAEEFQLILGRAW